MATGRMPTPNPAITAVRSMLPRLSSPGLDLGAHLLDLGGELADAAADQRETPDDAQGLARVRDGGADLDDVGAELRLGADVVPDEHAERHPHNDRHDDADIDPAHGARAEQLRIASHGPSSWSGLLYPVAAPARAICSRRTGGERGDTARGGLLHAPGVGAARRLLDGLAVPPGELERHRVKPARRAWRSRTPWLASSR